MVFQYGLRALVLLSEEHIIQVPHLENLAIMDLENTDFHRKIIENCVGRTKNLPAALSTT